MYTNGLATGHTRDSLYRWTTLWYGDKCLLMVWFLLGMCGKPKFGSNLVFYKNEPSKNLTSI